jgi:hypothetical protein
MNCIVPKQLKVSQAKIAPSQAMELAYDIMGSSGAPTEFLPAYVDITSSQPTRDHVFFSP